MFDYSAMTCLWGNEGAVGLEQFPISAALVDKLKKMCIEFDTIINLDDPKAGFVWTAEQIEDFRSRAHRAYDEMMTELGETYNIRNCVDLSLGIK